MTTEFANTISRPAQQMTEQTLIDVRKLLQAAAPRETIPHDIKCGNTYYRGLHQVLLRTEKPIIPQYSGIPIICDENMPPDVAEVRNYKGEVLKRFNTKGEIL